MPLQILSERPTRIHEFAAVSCAPGARGVEHRTVPVDVFRVGGLPPTLDALILTSDLQAYDTVHRPVSDRRLMGEVVAEELEAMCQLGLLPAASRCGVVLAGDLYAIATLDKRGGLGEVSQIWRSFARRFAWVTGVGGNHDQFGGECDIEAMRGVSGCAPLDGEACELDGLHIAGVSGIIGAKGRSWRRTEADFLNEMNRLLRREPDLLVLHEGPSCLAEQWPGSRAVERALDGAAHGELLVVCGHSHWERPLARLAGGVSVFNVDYRVVVLGREEAMESLSWFAV